MIVGLKDFLITKVAGKMLALQGFVGFIMVFSYDWIVQRPFNLGFWQLAGMAIALGTAYVGCVLNDFTEDM